MRNAVSALVIAVVVLSGCGGSTPTESPPVAGNPGTPPPTPAPPTPIPAPQTWDVNTRGIPKFAAVDYLEVSKVRQITRFRSSAGHDYSDSFESCRSMKHYFMPRDSTAAATMRIFSPVSGTVELAYPEWAGSQIRIQSTEYPAFIFVLFHVNLAAPLTTGQVLTAGQLLGTHIGQQTSSDMAVKVATPDGIKLVSWFDTMTDDVFATYQARGIADRSALIITRAERDADPLSCIEGAFTSWGTLPQWVVLQ